MSKRKKSFVGKIGYCENINLPGVNVSTGGHYVYIKKIDGKKCDVNVISSLEDNKGVVNSSRLKQVRKGNIYPIPIYDANFIRWSGIGGNTIKNVNISDIKPSKKFIKKRHKFYVGKFLK